MRIEAYRSGQAPDYGPLARHLLPKIREFYQDPKNEAAFQEWEKELEQYQDTETESAFVQWWKAHRAPA